MKPSNEYTIHILEDRDFNALPIGEPRKALGMTHAKSKTAWVRRTRVKDLDMNTINHEFDELMAKTSDHEIDGIRYKFDPISLLLNIAAAAAGSFAVDQGVKGLGRVTGLVPKPKEQAFTAPRASFVQSPFAPKTSAPGPLSEADFSKSLGNVNTNLSSRLSSLGSLFRGQAEPGNTAFAAQANAARQSAATSTEALTKQQEEAKRIAGII